MNRLLFILMMIFTLFISCKSNEKEEVKLKDMILKSALKTDDENIKEVFIVFYEGKKETEFQPEENFMFNLKKDNPYFKYNNFSEEGILKQIKDSIFINRDEKDKIDNFFKKENTLLKDVCGDKIGEKPVWKIYFMNKKGFIFKLLDINGEPQDKNIVVLKNSCEFLLEKIKKEKNKAKSF